jgi:hypothetical protein
MSAIFTNNGFFFGLGTWLATPGAGDADAAHRSSEVRENMANFGKSFTLQQQQQKKTFKRQCSFLLSASVSRSSCLFKLTQL